MTRLAAVKVEWVPLGLVLIFLTVAWFVDTGHAQVVTDGKICWEDSRCQSLSGETKGEASTIAQQKRVVRRAAKTRPSASDSRVGKVTPLKKLSSRVNPTMSEQGSIPTAHRVAIQVNQNDKAVMDLALNNARNVIEYYKAKGESVAIEIVTYGPGLHMLRADTSPVKERIAPLSLENPNLTFIACGNTQANQSKAEGKPITLLSEAKVTPSGVVHLIELQNQGYAYIRP